MINTDQSKSVLRALGALESYAWQIDTTSPKHFTVTAEVSGRTKPTDWQVALKKVQLRHPLVNARVDGGSDGRLYFLHDQSVEIPLRIARIDKILSIEHEIKREFSAPFGTGDVALLKAALLYGEERCVIIITAHHAIADGMSLAHFIYDILQTLAGESLPHLALLPSIEEICSTNNQAAGAINSPAFTNEPVPYAERSLDKLQVVRQRLSPELSASLREQSKRENTTVHGALTAAFAIALSQSPARTSRPVRICTPINARKYSSLDYGLSFLALFPTYGYHDGEAENFWEIARSVTADLEAYRIQPGMAALIDLVEPFMNNHGLNKMIHFDSRICAPDILISNLGVLNFSRNIGELTLESLWGPNVLIGTEGEQTIGVATINGNIHLIHTSYQSAPHLLEGAKKILTAVTGRL